MNRVKNLFALLFAFTILFCTGVTAFVQTGAEDASPPQTVYSEPAEAESGGEPIVEQLPEAAAPETSGQSSIQQGDAAEQPDSGSNVPYFAGAGIAVLVFAGAAVFCKIKGKN